ncbi:MAG: hypothetical protein CMP70_03455 [Flavobacteriales bacterium]|nr:hypothetical protein [Flavobacteriales bacterium]
MLRLNFFKYISFLVILFIPLVFYIYSYDSTLLDHMGYRQTQTALSTMWMSYSDSWIDFIFPVFGYPWLLPMEYPIFQIISSLISKLEFFSIETSGRLLSLVIYYLSLIPIRYILKNKIRDDLLFYIFYLTSPLLLYFSSKFLIDGFVFFLSVSVFATFLMLVKNFSIRNVILFVIFCNLCGLQKITGLMAALSGCGVYFIFYLISLKDKNSFIEIFKFSFVFLISIILPILWVIYSDEIKNSFYLTSFLTSDALSNWNYGNFNQRLDIYNLAKLFGWRITVLGGIFALFLRLLLFRFNKLEENKIAISCLTCGLFGPIFFFNLYLVHDYYLISSLAFIGIGLYLIPNIDAPRFNNIKPSANIFIAITLFFNLTIFSYWYMPKTNDIPSSHKDMYKIALKVKKQVDSDKVILTAGVDWDSTIPFYTGNYAIMLPSWQKNDFTPKVKGEYFDSLEVLSNLEDYLGNRELGAIVVCKIRMSEDFDVVVNFIKQKWKIDWKNKGLCSFGIIKEN